MSGRRPRIAVSGASGTGKTTLARALAERLGVPYVEEGMRRRIEGGLDLHRLGHDEHRALTEALLGEMIAATRAAESTHGGFVCDRSPIDFAAFWLYYRFAFDEAATDRHMRRVDESLSRLDVVVVLPRGAIALEDDGVRSANPWIQLHYDALLTAMLARAEGAVRVLRMPPGVVALERRVEHVLDALAR